MILVGFGLTIKARQHPVPLDGEHTYTADMLAVGRDGLPVLVEVKGSYRHYSNGRSRLAFDVARLRTGYAGIWIEQRKASKGRSAHWRIEVYR